MKRVWKLFSDRLGWVEIGADTDFGINRNKSNWFRMNFNPKVLPGCPQKMSHTIFFFQNFCSKIFFPKFVFPKFFPTFFFEDFTLDAFPFTETKRTLCICVMKNMISKRSKLHFSLLWLFFGSYCLHHTRREKFNSFPATHNILLYSFRICYI